MNVFSDVTPVKTILSTDTSISEPRQRRPCRNFLREDEISPREQI